MNKGMVLGVLFILILATATAAHHYQSQSVYDGYYRTYNPYHQGFYQRDDFQAHNHPRIYLDNKAKLDYFKSIGYYDPDDFHRHHHHHDDDDHDHDDEDEDDDEEDHQDWFDRYRRNALDVRRGSLEYFRAGYRAQSNYDIAFNKGYNDGYYGKQTYFDDDHEFTTWYRDAYYNGYYTGLDERYYWDRPG